MRQTSPLMKPQLCTLGGNANQHLVLTGHIQGNYVRIMVDSGANVNYVGMGAAYWLKTYWYDKEQPYQLDMADSNLMKRDQGWVKRELRDIQLQIQGHKENIALDIVDIKYDVILGMEWLAQHNPVIDWKKRTLEFPNCSHGQQMGARSASKVPFAKAIWVRPVGRALAGMAASEIPLEYKDFEDVFTEKVGSAALSEH